MPATAQPTAGRESRSQDPGWAWTRFDPDAQRPWTLAWAGHLYRRAAFGATWRQLQGALTEGPQRTIDLLLAPKADVVAFNRRFDDYESSASDASESLRAWWLRRMIDTPHPLLEKLTLFWHGHFAVSLNVVQNGRLLQRYVRMLRGHALGRFDSLVADALRDPAVFLGMEAAASRRALPNDRLARALLDPFTVGTGGYREEDVRETARALTGWFVFNGELRFIPREHDPGTKTILGQTGPFGIEDVTRIVLQQRSTSQHVVRRLFRWLISETADPEPSLIEPLVDAFSKSQNIAALVETMLRSNLFFSPAAYRRRLKNPIEYVLGLILGLEGSVPTERLAADVGRLGQELYAPPTVRGWAGGARWLTPVTMIRRQNLALALLDDAGAYPRRLDPQAVASNHGKSSAEAGRRFLEELLLQDDFGPTGREGSAGAAPAESRDASPGPANALRRAAWRVATHPEFHLC